MNRRGNELSPNEKKQAIEAPTNAACPETVPYGHGIDAVAVTIFANGNEPVVGAFGSEGARVLTGKLGAPDPVQSNTKGCVVKVYCTFSGGGAKGPMPQSETGSGLTVVGGAEKVPVAVN